ncbi:hypothetical protein PIB30_058250, partial [Stylosanthes scabra]|nr:hypothetical protein [Stylosanthes scabra]
MFVSGTATLNWVGPEPVTYNRMICSFDLANEAFGRVPLPAVNHDKISPPVLGVLRNALCLCYFDFEVSAGWNVWMMNEYGVQHSWTKLAMISASQ